VKVLIAPDKFKGSLGAVGVAEAIARGWSIGMPGAVIRLAPIADGGEGFSEVLGFSLGGGWVEADSRDPIGRGIVGRYVWVESSATAVIEMSESSGLWRLKHSEFSPMRANTFGTGMLIRDAINRGARRIYVGLGGSATTDGGVGMAAALGASFTDAAGKVLEPAPEHLSRVAGVDMTEMVPLPELIAACDVQNPLLGPRGTARVYAPQKGADAFEVERLESGLANLADVVARDARVDFRDQPGAGAAGGIGFGLLAFCGARMQGGFDLIASAAGLRGLVADADLVITGEGRLDSQTLDGKGPAGVAALARELRRPVLAFAGSVESSGGVHECFDGVIPIIDEPVGLEEAMRRGAEFIERAAVRAARLLQVKVDL
jgi:glycerate kinase